MSDEQFNKLLEVLGQVGKSVYETAIQRAWADGITSVAMFLGTVFFVLVAYNKATKFASEKDWGNDYEGNETIFNILKWATVLVVSAFGVFHLCNAFLILIAPKWYALELLSGLVK